MKKILLAALFFLSFIKYLFAYEITFDGQISIWSTYYTECRAGARYIPELSLSHWLSEGRNIDCVTALNMYTFVNDDFKLYRSWARYTSSQLEIRLGLQKINFGSAKILRSLMWFDRMDTRDPLQLSEGVNALLVRYYFLNNANIWGWALYGNNNLKGLEQYKTDKNRMELGGRFQHPVPGGEIALSLNRRNINKKDWNRQESALMSDGPENRFGLDGIWDIGAGLWVEAVASKIRINSKESLWQEFLTVGTDYTFSIGPGIHMLYEHFLKSSGSKIDKQSNTVRISAVSADFSIGMMERLNSIVYYDWKEEKVYIYFGLQRAYDNWMVNLGVFSSSKDETGIYAGNGVLCMITYNH